MRTRANPTALLAIRSSFHRALCYGAVRFRECLQLRAYGLGVVTTALRVRGAAVRPNVFQRLRNAFRNFDLGMRRSEKECPNRNSSEQLDRSAHGLRSNTSVGVRENGFLEDKPISMALL